MQSNLNTQNANHYHFDTKYLDINILGGIRFNNLEALRVTLGLQKKGTQTVLRQSVDLYNDTNVEKLTRKIAERLEIGTSIVRQALDELTNALENPRWRGYVSGSIARICNPCPHSKPQNNKATLN